jgi:hypothetical protein
MIVFQTKFHLTVQETQTGVHASCNQYPKFQTIELYMGPMTSKNFSLV